MKNKSLPVLGPSPASPSSLHLHTACTPVLLAYPVPIFAVGMELIFKDPLLKKPVISSLQTPLVMSWNLYLHDIAIHSSFSAPLPDCVLYG